MGCGGNTTSNKLPVGTTVRDVHSYQYRLVTNEYILPNGYTQVELWERIKPLDTNHWYTPALKPESQTNLTPMFNSLSR